MDRFLVPENLDIQKLQDICPSDDIPGFHVAKVYFVCHSIYHGMELLGSDFIHPEKRKPYFVPLHSRILGKVLGKNNYKALLNWMEAADIIRPDGSWKDGRISQGYRYTPTYLASKHDWRTAKYWHLEIKNIADCYDHDLHFQKNVVKGLKRWFNTKKLKIDADKANKEISENLTKGLSEVKGKWGQKLRVELTAQAGRRKIAQIKEGNYLFTQDPFGYRLHTSITQLPRELRKFVTFDGKPLVEVDISCSQLFFSNFIMDSRHWMTRKNKTRNQYLRLIWDKVQILNSKHIDKYNKCIMCLNSPKTFTGMGFQGTYFLKKTREGELYDTVLQKLEIDTPSVLRKHTGYDEKRQHVKTVLLEQVYASPWDPKHKGLFVKPNGHIWNCFKTIYPDEAKLFILAKRAFYKDLCMLLQRIETTAILGYACKRILREHPEIPLFTLHDCLVTTTGNEGLIMEIMEQEIEKFMGVSPAMKIKEWATTAGDKELCLLG